MPVIAIQPVLRAGPQKPGAILQEHLHRQVLQPFIFAVKLEVIPLREHAGRNHQQGENPQTHGAHKIGGFY
jgi:hypothetical protein